MQQIMDGLKLMLAGMGTVFTFLIVMILWIVLAAKVTGKYAHLLPEPAQPETSPRMPETDDEDNDSLIVAISTAVHKYRQEKGQGN